MNDQGLGVSLVGAFSLSAGGTKNLALNVNTKGLKPVVITAASAGAGKVIAFATVKVTVPDFSNPAALSRSGYWMVEADGDLYAFGDV
ncbi:MAG: hypothetical protein ACC652_08845, partial [Acidimicrobiales bacterium]